MAEDKYNLKFLGLRDSLPDTRHKFMQNMPQLFKVRQDQIEKIIAKAPVTIGKNLNRKEAELIGRRIVSIGGKIKIEIDHSTINKGQEHSKKEIPKIRFDIFLLETNNDLAKHNIAKYLRKKTNKDYVYIKNKLFKKLPSRLPGKYSYEEAERIKSQLEEFGSKVLIKESKPISSKIYRDTWLRIKISAEWIKGQVEEFGSKVCRYKWSRNRAVVVSFISFLVLAGIISATVMKPNPNMVQDMKKKYYESKAIAIPGFKLVDAKVHDVPIETQVTLGLAASSKDITKDELEAVLKNLYTKVSKMKGFKYRKYPNAVYIYIYRSTDEVGYANPLAKLKKSAVDKHPSIIINERQLAFLKEPPKEKFGLSEAKRREIYKEMIRNEDSAQAEADAKFPLDGLTGSKFKNEADKNVELFQKLNAKYQRQLAQKYGLSTKQLMEIGVEGITKEWPMP